MSLQQLFLILKERTFSYGMVCIDIPDDLIKQLIPLSEKIAKEDLTTDGIETYPHITVKYGLTEKDVPYAIEIIENGFPFSLTTGETKLFEAEEYDVVVIGVQMVPFYLQDLHNKIPASGKVKKYPKYNPHITIGYVKSGKGQKYLNLTMPPQSFDIKVMTVKQKQEIIKVPIGKVQ